jgi:hypothetical protein
MNLGVLSFTLTMRGCAYNSPGSCDLLNSILCPPNSTSTCLCGICSTNRCNDDTIATSSAGSGQNYTVLLASLVASGNESNGNSGSSKSNSLKLKSSFEIYIILAVSLFLRFI